MSDFNLQFLTSGVGVLTGPGGRVGFPNYAEFKLVKRYLYGKLDANDNVTNGEIELFIDSELDIIQSWLDKVREPTYHFRIIQKSDGSYLAALCAPGFWYEIPSPEYLNLLVSRGLASRQILRVPTNEFDYYKALYLTPEQNDAAILRALQLLPVSQAQEQASAAVAAPIPAKTEGVPEGITPSAS